MNLCCCFFWQGVRVVLAANFPTEKLGNKELRTKWIKNLTKETLARHADGVNIDIESPIPKRSREVTLLTKLVNETRTAFRQVMKHSQVSFQNSLEIIEVGNCYKGVRISNWVLKPSEFPYNWLLYINQDNRCSGTKFSFVQVTFFSIFLSWQPWADPEKGTYKLYRSYLFCWEFFKTNIEFHRKRFGHSPLGQPLNLPMYCILQPIECNLRISIIDVFWYLLLFHCC